MNTLNSWKSEAEKTNWIPYSYQTSDKKSTKQSVAQRSFRAKFGLANSILTNIRLIIKTSFIKYNRGRKSGYNTAVGLFLSNAVRGDYPNFEVNFAAMEVSKGTLPGLDKWEFSVNDREVSLTWKNEGKNTNADDSVYLLLFNISKRSFIPVIDLAERADQKIRYTVSVTENNEFVAWTFAINRDLTNSSNSQFLGKFKIKSS